MRLYLLILIAGSLICGCQKGFFLMQGEDFHHHSAPDGPEANTLHQFPEGIYLARICSYERIVDGQTINAFRSCPTAALDADSLDKTAFFVFLDHQRVIYYSNDALWSSSRRIRHNNNVSDVTIKLDQTANRKKKVLRGYYAIEPVNGIRPGQKIVKMHLEKMDSAQIFIHLMLDASGVLSVLEIGYADKANFKDSSTPPMIAWNTVFDNKLDFHFYNEGMPELMIGGKKIGAIECSGNECRYLEKINPVDTERPLGPAKPIFIDVPGRLGAW